MPPLALGGSYHSCIHNIEIEKTGWGSCAGSSNLDLLREQAHQEGVAFLRSRAKELVVGGKLFLAVPATVPFDIMGRQELLKCGEENGRKVLLQDFQQVGDRFFKVFNFTLKIWTVVFVCRRSCIVSFSIVNKTWMAASRSFRQIHYSQSEIRFRNRLQELRSYWPTGERCYDRQPGYAFLRHLRYDFPSVPLAQLQRAAE